MELCACITALREALKFDKLDKFDNIVIYTDSMYIVDNHKNAMYVWPKTKWKKQGGSPVSNVRLWKDFVRCMKKEGHKRKRITIEWVGGRTKNIHNKAVDKLAKQSAKNATAKQISIVSVRRKKSHKSVELGSVKMQGQKISIRIISSQHLNVQGVWKYKYEVVSKKSRYYGNVDIIYCKEFLSSGHVYQVCFNKNNDNPWVSKVFGEIEETPRVK